MADFEAGIRRSMFDEASSDYAAWYGQAGVIASEMFPRDPILADSAGEAMFLHLADLSEELDERTEFIPDWVEVDQVEDWIAGRAAAAVADNVTLASQLAKWQNTEAGLAYAAVERVDQISELDEYRAQKALQNMKLPQSYTDLVVGSLSLFSGVLRDPAIQRGLESAHSDPDVFGAYVTHLTMACSRKTAEARRVQDRAVTDYLAQQIEPIIKDSLSDRIWKVA